MAVALSSGVRAGELLSMTARGVDAGQNVFAIEPKGQLPGSHPGSSCQVVRGSLDTSRNDRPSGDGCVADAASRRTSH